MRDLGMLIYSWNYDKVALTTIALVVIWTLLWLYGKRKLVAFINYLAVAISVYGVFYFTVFGRSASDMHHFSFMSVYTTEFYRELIMNAFLYVPFGVSVPFVTLKTKPIGVFRTCLIAAVLASAIECWQYVCGTGYAQVSDVVMNTFGAFIGSFAFVLKCYIEKRNAQV